MPNSLEDLSCHSIGTFIVYAQESPLHDHGRFYPLEVNNLLKTMRNKCRKHTGQLFIRQRTTCICLKQNARLTI